MGFPVFLLMIINAVYIALIIAEWRILTKAGEKGWKSLIPVYNLYVSHHIVGMSHIWFILEIILWIIEVVFETIPGIPGWIGIAFGIPTVILTLVSEIVHINRLCNCFGKGIGFKIGMCFAPYIFGMIIAFSDAEYRCPKEEI